MKPLWLSVIILCLTGCASKIDQPFYLLEAGLIVDGRQLTPLQGKLARNSTITLYFEDKTRGQTYQLRAYLKAGEQEGTVDIYTWVSTDIISPSFLVFEGQQASALFPASTPNIEVQVKATRMGGSTSAGSGR